MQSAAHSKTQTAKRHLQEPRRHPLAHLPGEDGWPIVGNTLAALKDPAHHVEAMYRKYGPVYRDHLFGIRTVAMLGPEANELVLFDRDRNFSSSNGWGFLLDRLFPRGLMRDRRASHRACCMRSRRVAAGLAEMPSMRPRRARGHGRIHDARRSAASITASR